MAGRKRALSVARPTGKRRLVELGKDALIAILACTAILLALQTPMLQQFQGLVTSGPAAPQHGAQPSDAAVTPYAVAARNSMGLYGVAYDEGLLERTFSALSPTLGQALVTAQEPQRMTQRQWLALLDKPGIYCAFQGRPPLPVLAQWLGGDAGALTGDAQILLLSWDGAQVWLCWQEDDAYFRAGTQLSYADDLEEMLSAYVPNGAAFAGALAATDDAYGTLDPSILIPMTAPRPQEYTTLSPDFVSDAEALEQLLQALGFQSGVGSAYQAGSDLAITESGDRLRVGAAGAVTFHAGDDARYTLSAQGSPTLADAAQTCWQILGRAVAPWKGELSYILDRAEATDGGWDITFSSRLQGVPVVSGANGWCASFSVRGNSVSDFTLSLRSYAPTGSAPVLPSQRLAAAALNSLPGSTGELMLCYTDTTVGTLTAGWMAQD